LIQIKIQQMPVAPRNAHHNGHQHRRSNGSGNELLWFAASPLLALARSEAFLGFIILALLLLLG
jgi:hypothetical protein